MINNINKQIDNERYEALYALEEWLEVPVFIMAIIWLIIFIIELIWKVNPLLEVVAIIIWIIFIFDFSLRFFLAPQKGKYISKNWLTALSLLLPALRIFRIFRLVSLFRATRAVRGIRLLKVFGSFNRGIKALRAGLARRGFIYIFLLTILVVLLGAAGMYAFENNVNEKGFTSYSDSVWWTAMIMTTLGSEFWPQSFEGRVLGFFLSLYAFAVFGYITAMLATFFIGRDAENEDAELAGDNSVKELKSEVMLLRQEISRLKLKK
jgi:voltage-gated potassium channel